MEKAVGTMPDSSSFLHRLGWLYENIGNKGEAIAYYEKAVKIQPNYFEARLSLLNLKIELNLPSAKKEIDELDKSLVGRHHLVLESLKAKHLLFSGKFEEAYELSNNVLKHERSEITLSSALRIELERAEKLMAEKLTIKTKESLNTAKNYYNELRHNPKSRNLDVYEDKIEQIQKRLDKMLH